MKRQNQLKNWVTSIYPNKKFTMNFAAADADFRRYFKIVFEDKQQIICMDAPPEKMSIIPFIEKQKIFSHIYVPKIFFYSIEQGFIALEYLGDKTFLTAMLENENQEYHHQLLLSAVNTLVELQAPSKPNILPDYNKELLLKEINLFREWYLPYHLKTEFNEKQKKIWENTTKLLIDNILNQPKVYVHKDFIVRNLMITDNGIPGVIDFQDALYGPITYDIISLTQDVFVEWDEKTIIDIIKKYWQKIKNTNSQISDNFNIFYKDIELMGIQRHLKNIGIFSRLLYRDHKDKYIKEVPRLFKYVLTSTKKYPEFHDFNTLLNEFKILG